MNGLKSLFEIFNNSVFRIPDYQRAYAWGESQILDFWNDLVNLVDKHDHYTGMLSLKEIDTYNDEGWSKKDKTGLSMKVIKLIMSLTVNKDLQQASFLFS